MANKVFSSYRTGKSKDATNDQQLIVEVGTNHLACLVKVIGKQMILDFELFTFNQNAELDFEDNLHNALTSSTILHQSYNETKVFINNEYSLLAPAQGFTKESMHNYLYVVYGDASNDPVFVDTFKDEGFNNVYKISNDWLSEVNRRLKVEHIEHVYSSIIRCALEQVADDNDVFLKLVFYPHHFIVALVLQQRLHLIQTFYFASGADVLYHLLNIRERFSMSSGGRIQVSGMIDTSSSLLIELRQYFKEVSFDAVATNASHMDQGSFPKHYFTPFYNLAK